METIIRKIDKNQINQDVIEEAGNVLKQGGLVAFPTETVYGLGADALKEEAAKKTYAAKGRPSDNPRRNKISIRINDQSKELLERYCSDCSYCRL